MVRIAQSAERIAMKNLENKKTPPLHWRNRAQSTYRPVIDYLIIGEGHPDCPLSYSFGGDVSTVGIGLKTECDFGDALDFLNLLTFHILNFGRKYNASRIPVTPTRMNARPIQGDSTLR